MSAKALSITSTDNPRVKRVLKLRKQRERRATGLFIAEGVREVTRAIDAGLTVRELYVCADLVDAALTTALVSNDIPRFDVSEPVARKLAYRENPEGVLAVVEQPAWSLAAIKLPPSSLLLVAIGIHKPGNLGAMARSAAGAGAHALLVADGVVDPFNPNAIRASTGAVFTLPVVCESSDVLIDWLTPRAYAIVAATPDADRLYDTADLTGPTAVVIGAEDVGVPDVWLTASSATAVRVPMADAERTGVDSLNASVTAALLLFEAARQRRGT